MRYLYLILLFLVSEFANGQKWKFQLHQISACDNIEKIDSAFLDYFLKDSTGKEILPDTTDPSLFILPHPGPYEILYHSRPETYFPSITLNDTGLTIFTYKYPKIVLRYYGMHFNRVFEVCNTRAEGYQEDFYPNGNIRIRGNFVKGKPKDSLVTFYPNGSVKERLQKLPTQNIIEKFDSLFHLIEISYNSNKSYFLTDYKTTEYFSNGKVYRKESRKDHIMTIKEFYPGGTRKTDQKKKSRKEFYETGRKKIIYTSKYKREKEIASEGYRYNFTIFKKVYDENSRLIESVVYEYWNSLDPQPAFEIARSDWIIKWVIIENGKRKIKTKDVNSKEYFKKGPY